MGWVEVMSLLQKRWFYKVLGEAEGNVAMTVIQISGSELLAGSTGVTDRRSNPVGGSRIRVGLSNKRPRVAGLLCRRDRSALQKFSGRELLTKPAPGGGGRESVWASQISSRELLAGFAGVTGRRSKTPAAASC
jgi:hypothetical protein